MTRRIIGILGGMGPLATADLYQKIIAATPASRDQDHLHVIIDADPSVPDRTEALLYGGPDPTPWLVAGARRLEQAGADFLLVPCNTAHAFLPRVQPAVRIPILSMVRETATWLAEQVGPGQRVGVLATEGTVRSRLYHQALEAVGLQPVAPEPSTQAEVSAVIAAVKAGHVDAAVRARIRAAALAFVEHTGAQALIAACTELPLVLEATDVPVLLADPTALLARAAVAIALGQRPLPEPLQEPAVAQAESCGGHA
ncbi:MAG: amino acid racemase [Thermorudis peleae]|nr:amino acid racemase [Thermorudis peleae]